MPLPDDAPVLDVDLTRHDLYRQGVPWELLADVAARGDVQLHPRATMPKAPDGLGFWAVFGHALVQQVNRDWETFSAAAGPLIVPTEPHRMGHVMPASDPPEHGRLRKLVSAGFTSRMIDRLDDQLARRTREVLDAVAERGECDFVADVAYPVPMHLIADIMGIPEPDRTRVFALTDTFMRWTDPEAGISRAEARAAEQELYAYAQELGEEKRRNPGDDVWSLIAAAEIEDDDGHRSSLTQLELDGFFLILSVAGSETTRNAISGGLVALLEHPDQLAALRADRSLLDTAVEEVLRWVTPVVCFGRTATRDVELAGRHIRAGERVTIWFATANRDERAFDAPDRFDVRRSPNPHTSFGGGGLHFCLGAHLARREIRTVLDELLDRFDGIEITAPPTWVVAGPSQTVAASIERLPVRLHAR